MQLYRTAVKRISVKYLSFKFFTHTLLPLLQHTKCMYTEKTMGKIAILNERAILTGMQHGRLANVLATTTLAYPVFFKIKAFNMNDKKIDI